MNYKYLDWGSIGGPKSGLDITASAFTRVSLAEGFIPKECPVCHRSTDRLVLHHWLGKNISEALLVDCCRRICPSCNSLLGVLFKDGCYPTWEEQIRKLGYEVAREGWWSRVAEEEGRVFWNSARKVIDGNKKDKESQGAQKD